MPKVIEARLDSRALLGSMVSMALAWSGLQAPPAQLERRVAMALSGRQARPVPLAQQELQELQEHKDCRVFQAVMAAMAPMGLQGQPEQQAYPVETASMAPMEQQELLDPKAQLEQLQSV